MDMHAHILSSQGDYQRDHLQKSSAQKALDGLRHAQALLMAGWTTLRIPGDADVHYAYLAVRDAIDRGELVNLGMSPIEAIRAATVVPAEMLGWNDKLGALEVGKLADIIAVAEDPLKNISALEKVVLVMKDGVVMKNEIGK